MDANRVIKPPAGPHRRTPDHPPYAVMIGAAIRSLAEEGGSAEAAISQHIRANYDDLPWAHDKLLPYYLNKLTAVGEFVEGSPGRYLVGYDDSFAEPPVAASGPAHAESGPAKPSHNKGDGPAGPSSTDGDDVVDQPSKSLPPPSAKGMAHESNDADGGHDASRSMEENQPGDVGSSLPFPVPMSSQGKEGIEPEPEPEPEPCVLALPRPEPVMAASKGDGSKPAPRRRGRPPKNKPVHIN